MYDVAVDVAYARIDGLHVPKIEVKVIVCCLGPIRILYVPLYCDRNLESIDINWLCRS